MQERAGCTGRNTGVWLGSRSRRFLGVSRAPHTVALAPDTLQPHPPRTATPLSSWKAPHPRSGGQSRAYARRGHGGGRGWTPACAHAHTRHMWTRAGRPSQASSGSSCPPSCSSRGSCRTWQGAGLDSEARVGGPTERSPCQLWLRCTEDGCESQVTSKGKNSQAPEHAGKEGLLRQCSSRK